MSAVYFGLSRIRISPTRNRISARRGAGVCRQGSKALAAAAIASSTSSSVERGNRPTTSRVSAGFLFSSHSSLRLGVQRPLMKLWYVLMRFAAWAERDLFSIAFFAWAIWIRGQRAEIRGQRDDVSGL